MAADHVGLGAAAVWLALALLSVGVRPAGAQECAAPVGTVQSLEGEVAIGDAAGAWRPAQLGAPLCASDRVRTGALSRAALVLANAEVLRLDQETTLALAEVPLDGAQPTLLELAVGAGSRLSRGRARVRGTID